MSEKTDRALRRPVYPKFFKQFDLAVEVSVTQIVGNGVVGMKAEAAASKRDELERTIRELAGLAQELDRQIKGEEARKKEPDPAHPNYSSFAVSARERLARLRASIAFFEAQLKAAEISNDNKPKS
jgi:BMFP domain-containing protein YqiC